MLHWIYSTEGYSLLVTTLITLFSYFTPYESFNMVSRVQGLMLYWSRNIQNEYIDSV